MGKKKPTSYREASSEIEEILSDLEDDGQNDIDKLADRVERASELIRFCFARLKSAETRVRKVTRELGEATQDADEDEE